MPRNTYTVSENLKYYRNINEILETLELPPEQRANLIRGKREIARKLRRRGFLWIR
ncbi:hypothetical protein [Streptomyces sp. NPDC017988]|uniref:hypothetical protein n=1 Tax=Streptomyces sp. NPDC017988 TaxID=3365025 RepID=UPI00378735C3